MQKIEVKKVMFSSGKITVDYDLPSHVDPILMEKAVYGNTDNLNCEYNELEIEKSKLLPETEDDLGACKGCLNVFLFGLTIVGIIALTKHFGLW